MNKKKVFDLLMLVAFIVSLIVVGIFLYEFVFVNGYYKTMGRSVAVASGFLAIYCCHYVRQEMQNKHN